MKIRSFVPLLFVLGLGLAAAACGSTPSSPTSVSTLSVTGAAPAVGASAQFSAMATSASGTVTDVTTLSTWTSSNTAVAIVTPSGLVSSIASGPVVISATYSGVAGSESITVP